MIAMDCVLLDNSIQIDRLKSKVRRDRIDEVLSASTLTVSTGTARLEFKATLIAQLMLIYHNLRAKQSFTLVRDSLLEKHHPQSKLRSHIFNNIILIVAGSSFDITPEADQQLAERACLQLKQIIPRLFDWFSKSVDSLQISEVNCSRSSERPALKNVRFETNLPTCLKGNNKHCYVEKYVREKIAPLLPSIRSNTDSEQLLRACDLIEQLANDPAKDDYSHGDCRRIGDCLIVAEGLGATHGMSTNGRDWAPLCSAHNIEFVLMNYPGEKTA